MIDPHLSAHQARVLGVLIEKQHTVPDIYPMTLNAITSGCNQKTSRQPLMNMSETEVQATIDQLKAYSLVIESSGGRVMRYAHNTERVLKLPSQSVALLAVLMLRGPQTSGELRINCERLHKFADISAVEAFLDELATRNDGALVKELPRQPGERENRWAHLLSGEPATDISSNTPIAVSIAADSASEIAALRAEVSVLADEVAALKATVSQLSKKLNGKPDSV